MYTERDWERLFDQLLGSGMPVSSFCELPGTPSRKTMWRALAAHPDVLEEYRELFPGAMRRRASRLGGPEETGPLKVHDLPGSASRTAGERRGRLQELEDALARAEAAEARSAELAAELERVRAGEAEPEEDPIVVKVVWVSDPEGRLSRRRRL
ncbi:hypothetical protein AAK967_09060 [Atopobiaceae bacterium 24-176]